MELRLLKVGLPFELGSDSIVLLAFLDEKFEAEVIEEFDDGKKCWDNRRSKVGLVALSGPAVVLALARPLRVLRAWG